MSNILSNEAFIEVLHCPVCNSARSNTPEFNILYFSTRVVELNFIVDIPEIQLLRCRSCNHCYTSHILKPEVLDNYYSNISSENYSKKVTKSIDKQINERKWIVDIVEQYYPGGGRILDVGCGYGYQLSYFNPSKWERFGVEPSSYATERARDIGVNVISKYVVGIANTQKESFDIIMLIDVIEHLSEPNAMIKELFSLLKKNGLLLISTGNIDSINAKMVGAKWSYFNSYEHISFYNPLSMKYILNQHGFTSVKIMHTSYERNLIKNSFSFLKNLIRYIFFVKLRLREINVSPLAFDHFFTIAKK